MKDMVTIAPIPKLAELREAVLAHSEKPKPKWGFRIAPDIVMELQAQPCTLLSEWSKANGCKQAVVSFEGKAVMTAGAGAADLKKHKRGAWEQKFSLLQFADEPDWQLTLGNRTWPGGSNADSVAPLSAAIVASLQGDSIFTRLTPERMLKPACMICGKGLTDPASMARWIGPECAATTSIRVFHETPHPEAVEACNELPASIDPVAAANEAAEFLFQLEDLIEQYNEIAGEMAAAGHRLCASLDLRSNEAFADFIIRHGTGTPQALVASIACTLICAPADDLQTTVRMLDHALTDVLKQRSEAASVTTAQGSLL